MVHYFQPMWSWFSSWLHWAAGDTDFGPGLIIVILVMVGFWFVSTIWFRGHDDVQEPMAVVGILTLAVAVIAAAFIRHWILGTSLLCYVGICVGFACLQDWRKERRRKQTEKKERERHARMQQEAEERWQLMRQERQRLRRRQDPTPPESIWSDDHVE